MGRDGRKSGCDKTVALVGSPNVGKTTLFNTLTGSSELVANWPGATVAVKYVKRRLNDLNVCIVDLPGTYSIHGTGPEEKVTREFILRGDADLILVLADSTNLERGIFLAIDVVELFPNTIVVLTKFDEAQKRGIKIDVEKLSRLLGVPVVGVSALTGEGVEKLRQLISAALHGATRIKPVLDVVVPPELKELHARLVKRLEAHGVKGRLAKWLAARLLEETEWAEELLKRLLPGAADEVAAEARRLAEEARRRGIEPSTAFVAAKYEIASRIVNEAVVSSHQQQPSTSPVDRVFLHPMLGPIASLASMFAVFLATYVITTGSPLDLLLDSLGFHHAAEIVTKYSLVNLVAEAMDRLAAIAMSTIPNPVIAKMIGEGVLSSGYGVGLVVSFLPLVAILMMLIGLLEDSGLVPRIAAGVDGFFRRFGVSGKAVFPAMLSLGCNVPGVLATRVLDNPLERRAVVFAVPLVPCMARFTVLMAFAHVFFPGGLRSAAVVFAIYMLSIALFLLTLRLMTRGEAVGEEFLLELPPLKKPSLKVVWWLTWDKIKHFLVRAGTVITFFSIVLWLLANYGPSGYLGDTHATSMSYASMLGRVLAPYISAIIGVGEDLAWRLGFGFIGGFVAKEVFLDALAAVAPGPKGLWSYHLTPAQALAVMVAVTLYIPCVATLSAMYSETGEKKLVLLAFIYDMVLASVAAAAVRLLAALV